jgi:hypothetical protein
MTALRLLVQDADDLSVISASLQDSVAKMGDIAFDKQARRLTLAVNRYRWEAKRGGERVRTGLQVGGVLAVASRNLKLGAKEAVVELLSIGFEPGEAPGGVIHFTFAGGGDLRVEVECIDMVLADVSAPWPAKRRPTHS